MSVDGCVQKLPLLYYLLGLLIVMGFSGRGVSDSLDSGSSPDADRKLFKNVTYGVRFEAEYEEEVDYLDEDHGTTSTSLIRWVTPAVAISWKPSSRLSLYSNLELLTPQVLEHENTDSDSHTKLEVDKLYVSYRFPDGSTLWTAGRQRIKDSREWIMDDTLDGVSAQLSFAQYRVSGALMRGSLFGRDLIHHDDLDRVEHLWLALASEDDSDFSYTAFYFGQRDPDRNERMSWYGVQLQGEIEDLDYWAQAAYLKGKRRSRDARGYGFDIGGVYRLWKRPRVYMIGGYAHGSGDEQDEDLGFRQTDLQDNAAKLGGVARIAYYGEAFDPELSNITIATLGVGIRPNRDMSIDFLWHRYHQDVAMDKMRDSGFDLDPDGDSRKLGQELDLVFGWRWQKHFKVEAVVGLFLPERAFRDADDQPTLFRLEMRYEL